MNRARNQQQAGRLLSATSDTADGAGLDSTDGHTLFDQIKEKNVKLRKTCLREIELWRPI